jgi:hypothetical protein
MNIQFFASRLKNGGARPTLFEVQGAIGPEGQVSSTPFLVESASLPASTLGVITVPFRGRLIKLPGDRRYNDWSITIINDGEFRLRNAFEAWVNTIQAAQSNRSDANNHTPYNSPIYADWQVNQLDRSGNPIKSYLFVGCFPVEVGAIDLSAGAGDEIERFTVTLAYSYFVTKEAIKNTKRNTTDGQGQVDVKPLTGGG